MEISLRIPQKSMQIIVYGCLCGCVCACGYCYVEHNIIMKAHFLTNSRPCWIYYLQAHKEKPLLTDILADVIAAAIRSARRVNVHTFYACARASARKWLCVSLRVRSEQIHLRCVCVCATLAMKQSQPWHIHSTCIGAFVDILLFLVMCIVGVVVYSRGIRAIVTFPYLLAFFLRIGPDLGMIQ